MLYYFNQLFLIINLLLFFLNKEYKNEVVLKNLPVNREYRFRVAVFKKDSIEFSDMSDPSDSIKIQPSKSFFFDGLKHFK